MYSDFDIERDTRARARTHTHERDTRTHTRARVTSVIQRHEVAWRNNSARRKLRYALLSLSVV
jgi:hypothetical protein